MIAKKPFKKIYIEITNACNLSCSFCPPLKREKRMMTTEEFRHLLIEAQPYSDYVNLHVMGEPTLHPQLGEMLQIGAELGYKVNITTNGTRLTSEVVEVLLNAIALNKVSVSLHSFEANDAKMTMEEYFSSVIAFAKKASETNRVITALRLWNLDGAKTVGEHELNSWIMRTLQEAFPTEEPIVKQLETGRDVKLATKTFLQIAEKFEWPDSSKQTEQTSAFCYALRDHVAILVDGTVVPCCLDHDGEIPLGNALKQPLSECLEGKRARAIYNGFSGRKAVEALCKRCGYVERFAK